MIPSVKRSSLLSRRVNFVQKKFCSRFNQKFLKYQILSNKNKIGGEDNSHAFIAGATFRGYHLIQNKIS
jgi:hypothetical protein